MTKRKAVVPEETGIGKEASSFRPLDNRVLILRDEEEKVISGIIIPDAAREKPMKGIVIQAGPGSIQVNGLIPMSVRPGDKVVFGKYGFEEMKLDGKEYLLMRETDIFAIL